MTFIACLKDTILIYFFNILISIYGDSLAQKIYVNSLNMHLSYYFYKRKIDNHDYNHNIYLETSYISMKH